MSKLVCALAVFLLSPAAWAQSDRCAALAKLALPHAAITLAETQAPGAFHLAQKGDAEQEAAFHQLPAFCRVALNLTPSADSNIAVEVWLPEQGWNRRLFGVGNGGFAGEIDYGGLATGVQQGYAAVATDTGHTASFIDAQWALGHPEKIADFGYRAIHEMTVAAKTVIQHYYAAAPAHSYFESCSDGGREALMEAQRFPTDYNGILAGAPANDWTRLTTNAVRISQALMTNPASYFSSAKLPAIQAAVIAACGAQSGTQDGFVNNPPQCHFDPSVLLCKGDENDQCLTQPQIAALQAIYADMRSASGAKLFPGYSPGGEVGGNGWGPWIVGSTPRKSLMYLFGTRFFADMVYSDAQWTMAGFTVDQDLADALRHDAKSLDSTDPNLRPFAHHGGKLILYHGWSDPAIPPMSTVDYYESVRSTVGAATEDSFVRLYMVPGMQHCAVGPGPDSFGENGPSSASGVDDAQHDVRLALEAWVEKGAAPANVIVAKYDGFGASKKIVMTRPLCAFPLVAQFKGSGDPTEASSFACVQPGK
ncbi:MAG TPA: tannase/feruloyl esterase family alpha/beta hydrolase [Acidobacteriaceae bacterium]|jgi:feruloyl esterase|nr:tannase/feruloyl esterase family alpha/beta hydrolase [Acidobacteriaceae bacterium]